MRKASAAERDVTTLRIPTELRERIGARMRGRFTSVSEYIRDLIRRDVEDCPPVLVPVTENFRKPDGASSFAEATEDRAAIG